MTSSPSIYLDCPLCISLFLPSVCFLVHLFPSLCLCRNYLWLLQRRFCSTLWRHITDDHRSFTRSNGQDIQLGVLGFSSYQNFVKRHQMNFPFQREVETQIWMLGLWIYHWNAVSHILKIVLCRLKAAFAIQNCWQIHGTATLVFVYFLYLA